MKYIVNLNLQNLQIENMSQLDTKIGPKIKAFRRQLGLQANKLAEELNISPSYLNLIEGGKRKIDGDLLLKVCEKLKIELSDLTSKSDVNLENTISEILDDKIFYLSFLQFIFVLVSFMGLVNVSLGRVSSLMNILVPPSSVWN